MSKDALANVVNLDVLRSLREGDVVWVTLRDGLDDEEVEAVQHVLSSVITEDVSLIVTRLGYVEGIRQVPLSELMQLRQVLDDAIDAYAALNAKET